MKPKTLVACKKRAEQIFRLIGGDVGGEIHITAKDGTDLRLKVPAKNWQLEVDDRESAGTNGSFGELFTAPYWASGTYVLRPGDFLANPINWVHELIRLRIEQNFVVLVEGRGRQAKTLKQMLADAKNPKAYCLGEFSIGVSPTIPTRTYRSVVAEKLRGGIHIALGSNLECLKEDCPELERFIFGRYDADVNINCIKFGATVTFNGKKIRL